MLRIIFSLFLFLNFANASAQEGPVDLKFSNCQFGHSNERLIRFLTNKAEEEIADCLNSHKKPKEECRPYYERKWGAARYIARQAHAEQYFKDYRLDTVVATLSFSKDDSFYVDKLTVGGTLPVIGGQNPFVVTRNRHYDPGVPSLQLMGDSLRHSCAPKSDYDEERKRCGGNYGHWALPNGIQISAHSITWAFFDHPYVHSSFYATLYSLAPDKYVASLNFDNHRVDVLCDVSYTTQDGKPPKHLLPKFILN